MPSQRKPRNTRHQFVLDAIEAAGPAGIQTSSVTGMRAEDVAHVATLLVGKGEVFKGKRSHKTVRFFLKEEWAQAYVAATAKPVDPVRISKRAHANWNADAPIHYPKNPDGSPAYKHTIIERREPPGDAPIRTTYYQPG